jgi:transcriptional regulator with XRE-family HTH domain
MSIALGGRLRSLRKARGLSQEDVARRTGIGLKAYGDLERGRTLDPHYSTLEGVAYALGTTVAELIAEEEPAVPLADPPRRKAGQSLLERAQDAARQDEKREGQAINRLFASEGVGGPTHMTGFEEDKFRAELRALGLPDELFETFVWPLVTRSIEQEREISRLKKEADREGVRH